LIFLDLINIYLQIETNKKILNEKKIMNINPQKLHAQKQIVEIA